MPDRLDGVSKPDMQLNELQLFQRSYCSYFLHLNKNQRSFLGTFI